MVAADERPKLRRRRKKAAARKDGQMPCWKQYTMLLLGTIFVGVCQIAAITWMATMEPLQANVRCAPRSPHAHLHLQLAQKDQSTHAAPCLGTRLM